MLRLIGTAENYVRHQGIHNAAPEELSELLLKPSTPAGRKLRRQLLEFIQEQAVQARQGERLLGSSEVLESIIGKFKYVSGERGPHGLTGSVLSIGALLGSVTVEMIENAMSSVTSQDVWTWCQSHLGNTVQCVRGRVRQALAEQKQKTLLLENA